MFHPKYLKKQTYNINIKPIFHNFGWEAWFLGLTDGTQSSFRRGISWWRQNRETRRFKKVSKMGQVVLVGKQPEANNGKQKHDKRVTNYWNNKQRKTYVFPKRVS